MSNPICAAIDTPDVARAEGLARALKNHVGYLKLGMEFFYANGASGYAKIAAFGTPIFLDLKLHDIPNTVAGGVRSLMRLDPNPAIINVHAAGGLEMMRAAAEAVGGRAKLIAVTLLTSLSDHDLRDIGLEPARDALAHACALASLARRAGLAGVVCSPQEVSAIREIEGLDFLTVVPGIRPEQSVAQDQKRIATPLAARLAGADILVIGRPITGAPDPARAVAEILDSLHVSA